VSPRLAAAAAAAVIVILSVGLAAAQTTVRTDVPAGRWRTVRVRAVRAGARLGVQVSLGGVIEIALVRGSEATRTLNLSAALFRAPVDRKLSFTVTAPTAGDYYVVLDNRRGTEAQSVELVLEARRPGATPPPPRQKAPGDTTL
jgi:hypothetical protein